VAEGIDCDSSHFDGASEAFRHWDEDGIVSASCARCHTGEGFKIYAATGADPVDAQPIASGLSCSTCHTGEDFAGDAPRRYVARVTFPGGKEVLNDEANPDDSFLCVGCHQGRVGKGDIDAAIAAGSLRFQNVHYMAAGATLFGSEAGVGYEYDGKTYVGKFAHAGTAAPAQCTFCHDIKGANHSFGARVTSTCTGCHDEATAGKVHTIRKGRGTDYDGNGDASGPLKAEVDGIAVLLMAQMQQAAANAGHPLVYDGNGYPYFYYDNNGNGTLDVDEAVFANRYGHWTAALVKAAHNYRQSQAERGAWAHNTEYIVQLLIDSIEDLGGDVGALNRP